MCDQRDLLVLFTLRQNVAKPSSNSRIKIHSKYGSPTSIPRTEDPEGGKVPPVGDGAGDSGGGRVCPFDPSILTSAFKSGDKEGFGFVSRG